MRRAAPSQGFLRLFDDARPPGYAALEEQWTFDPARHLAMEQPARVYDLDELGYTRAEIAECPSSLAITTPFRLLSEEGAKALLQVTRQLEVHATSTARIPKMVRGGIYRSRFLHDLCNCPILAEFFSDMAATTLLPHTMPLQLGHINYQPDDIARATDKWHWDGVGFDYVVMPSDPAALEGGAFVWFKGTKKEGVSLLEKDGDIVGDKRVECSFAQPGFAIFQQGNMVLHRVKKLTRPAERITMVNAYISPNVHFKDVSRFKDLQEADPALVLNSEWARHKAWISRTKIEQLLANLPYTTDKTLIIRELEHVISDIQGAIEDISSSGEAKGIYFGD
ncbi:hypothetical protein V2J74_18665 [Pseudomonas alliivorans]|nr:hypothetical protein [Pseudomonas alliivorans]